MTDTTPDYLLIGHISHDVTPNGPQLGGTVSFAAYTAISFGLQVGILTSAAPDEPLLRSLPPNVTVINVPSDHTTTFENRYTNGIRTQLLHHRAATLFPDFLPPTWRNARLVHLGPIAYEVDPTFMTAFENCRVCVTPQGWMRRREPDNRVTADDWLAAEEVLSQAVLTVMSREDIRHDPNLEFVFARFAPVLVVTDGMHGGVVYRQGQPQRFAAIEVEQLDPTGAGDVFATALHIAWHQLGDLDRAVRVAARLAGQSVCRVGFSSSPTPDEVARAMNEVSS